MKKLLKKRMFWAVSIAICVLLGASLLWQILIQKQAVWNEAETIARQIQQIMQINEKEIARLVASLKDNYTVRAKAATYMLDEGMLDETDVEELRKVAALLQIDEIHLFDEKGEIYAGTHPEYYHYSFDSGEQMAYFKPMLADRELSMCQDVTPNTAEGKEMMYAITWRKDGRGMVQIGVQPLRLLEALAQNELSYIFSLMPVKTGYTYMLTDQTSGAILACTRREFVGKHYSDLNFHLINPVAGSLGYHAFINGEPCQAFFLEYAGRVICVYVANSVIYKNIFPTMIAIFLCLLLVCSMMIIQIMRYIDRMVLRNINQLNHDLAEITAGNLQTRVQLTGAPELISLSNSINVMVETLNNNACNLSHIMDSFSTLVGYFVWGKNSPAIHASDKLSSLLLLDVPMEKKLYENQEDFMRYLRELCTNPVPNFHNVYQPRLDSDYFIKVDIIENSTELFGVVRDVTEEVLDRKQLQQERDHDMLTGLLARRAFYEKMDKLFVNPRALGESVLMMLDMDQFKFFNDTYGHDAGDHALRAGAELLGRIEAPNKLITRFGGDEFTVLIYGVRNRDELTAYIRHLREQMSNAQTEFHGKTMPIRFSAGYVFCSDHDCDYHEMLRMADVALYISKRRGRSYFTLYSASMDSLSFVSGVHSADENLPL